MSTIIIPASFLLSLLYSSCGAITCVFLALSRRSCCRMQIRLSRLGLRLAFREHTACSTVCLPFYVVNWRRL